MMAIREIYLDYGTGDKSLFDLLPFIKRVEAFTPEAPVIERQVTEELGGDGEVQTSPIIRYKARNIKFRIFCEVGRPEQFPLLEHRLYQMFARREPYYISDSYSPNKRFKVTGDNLETIEKEGAAFWKSIEITLRNVTGLAESKHTTEEAYNLAGENWNLGMNIPAIDNIPYKFTTRDFNVYNGGDVRIFPSKHDYEVRMYLTGSNIKITNRTTGESLTIKKNLTSAQEVKIVGQYIVINETTGIDFSGRFPSLAEGINSFGVENASSIDIQFITRFYYHR